MILLTTDPNHAATYFNQSRNQFFAIFSTSYVFGYTSSSFGILVKFLRRHFVPQTCETSWEADLIKSALRPHHPAPRQEVAKVEKCFMYFASVPGLIGFMPRDSDNHWVKSCWDLISRTSFSTPFLFSDFKQVVFRINFLISFSKFFNFFF